MASNHLPITLALVLTTVLVSSGVAQDCTNVLISMSPCLNYISGNSSNPSSACCTQLGSVVRSQPQCLCQVLNGGGSNLGLNINQTQALALPRACNVQTPPVSQCDAASPSGTPGSTPSSPNTNSGGGSKTVPSSGVGSSSATSKKLAVSLLFCLIFVASYVPTFNVA